MVRVREVHAKKIIGRKVVKDKEYKYEYYALPLNLYLPKSMVEKWGTTYIVELNEETGTITIKPKTATHQ